MTDMDCRPANFNDLPDIVKEKYVSGEVVKEFMVKCDFEGLEDVRVKTSHTTIVNTIDEIKTLDVKVVYCTNLIKMMAYTKTIEDIYAKGGKEWDKVCDDVVIYYCVRAILFNKPIPVIIV